MYPPLWTSLLVAMHDEIENRYSLPNHKISDELKSCGSFWMYPPLWTSLLVAMHDEIENTSISNSEYSFPPYSLRKTVGKSVTDSGYA